METIELQTNWLRFEIVETKSRVSKSDTGNNLWQLSCKWNMHNKWLDPPSEFEKQTIRHFLYLI